jgi:hypothetical protein
MSMLIASTHAVISPRWRVIAGSSLSITGLGHLATEIAAPRTPERDAILAAMGGWTLSLPGAERSVADLFWGFSLMMGVLLIGFGALIATTRPTRSSSLITLATTLVATAAAWRYFFVVPGVLTSLSALAATLACWGDRQRPRLG